MGVPSGASPITMMFGSASSASLIVRALMPFTPPRCRPSSWPSPSSPVSPSVRLAGPRSARNGVPRVRCLAPRRSSPDPRPRLPLSTSRPRPRAPSCVLRSSTTSPRCRGPPCGSCRPSYGCAPWPSSPSPPTSARSPVMTARRAAPPSGAPLGSARRRAPSDRSRAALWPSCRLRLPLSRTRHSRVWIRPRRSSSTPCAKPPGRGAGGPRGRGGRGGADFGSSEPTLLRRPILIWGKLATW